MVCLRRRIHRSLLFFFLFSSIADLRVRCAVCGVRFFFSSFFRPVLVFLSSLSSLPLSRCAAPPICSFDRLIPPPCFPPFLFEFSFLFPFHPHRPIPTQSPTPLPFLPSHVHTHSLTLRPDTTSGPCIIFFLSHHLLFPFSCASIPDQFARSFVRSFVRACVRVCFQLCLSKLLSSRRGCFEMVVVLPDQSCDFSSPLVSSQLRNPSRRSQILNPEIIKSYMSNLESCSLMYSYYSTLLGEQRRRMIQ